jgi:hypothetical protein
MLYLFSMFLVNKIFYLVRSNDVLYWLTVAISAYIVFHSNFHRDMCFTLNIYPALSHCLTAVIMEYTVGNLLFQSPRVVKLTSSAAC